MTLSATIDKRTKIICWEVKIHACQHLAVLASQKAAHFNRNGLGPSQQITYMSWVAEGILNVNQPWQNWTPKYFALQGSSGRAINAFFSVCFLQKHPRFA